MTNQKILIVAKLSNKKLIDKISPLLETTNLDFYISRRLPGYENERIHYINPPYYFASKGILGTLSSIVKTIINFRKIQPTFLITYFFLPHGMIGLLLAKLFRRKIIVSLIGSDIYFFERNPFRKIFIKLLNNADAIVVTGSNSKKKIERNCRKDMPVKAIYNTKKIIPFKEKISKEIDFIFVGNLTKNKQSDVIIKAFNQFLKMSKNKEKSLYIVGDGPEKQKLEKLVTDLGLNEKVILTGYRNDISNLMRKTKFLVMASKNEGLPAVIIEAMMNGCIPISTDVGDIGEAFQHNDFLVKYNQKDDNSVLIENLSTAFLKAEKLTKNQYEKLSESMIAQSMKFDYKNAGKLWIDLIKELNLD
ncbi:MAG: glycosyltransferase [Candidatus Heimdallarchaeota archaeon]